MILLAIAQSGIPLFEYTPMQVKQAVVGYGKAEKRQVMDMTRRLLHMQQVARPDDAADAIAIALCHARSSTSRLPQQVERGAGMFYYLNGKIAALEQNLAVVDCGGVGYACYTTSLYHIAAEDRPERPSCIPIAISGRTPLIIYGFATREERRCFELLLSVGGVGPKAALAVLSVDIAGPSFTLAVMTGDDKTLTSRRRVSAKKWRSG